MLIMIPTSPSSFSSVQRSHDWISNPDLLGATGAAAGLAATSIVILAVLWAVITIIAWAQDLDGEGMTLVGLLRKQGRFVKELGKRIC